MKLLTIHEIQSMQLTLIKEIDRISKKYDIKYYLISGSCLGAVRHNGFIPWDDDIDIALMREDYERLLPILEQGLDQSKYFVQNEYTECEFTYPLTRIVFNETLQEIPSRKHLHINHGMYLDIFPLDNVPDDVLLRNRQERQLRRMTTLINLKIYSKSKERYKNIVKKIISTILYPLSLSYLKNKRRRIIMRYDDQHTENVCSMASKYGYSKHVMPREIYGIPCRKQFEGVSLPFPEKTSEHLIRLFGKNYMEWPPIEKRPTAPPVYYK